MVSYESPRLLNRIGSQCINSLANATLGYLLLPTTVNLGTSITRLAISLAKRPEPSAQLTSQGGLEEGDARQTVVESTAELLQRALRACFQDRTSIDASSGSGPRTKKQGIYVIVNLTMKLLFQCRRIQLVSRTIPNIASNSPALGRYPKSQRVTYLYYLGRYHFSSNHFRWAYEVLQEAYNLCYPIAISQKRLILIYLMSSSIVLGRFPSRQLLARPECQTLAPRFIPLFQAIQRGDLYSFQQFFEGSQHGWLKRRAILLPLRNRCEVLVWRSLCRRIFVINGFPGDSRRAPTLDLGDVWAIATGLYAKGKGFHMLEPEPTPMEVETIVGSLVEQGFMRGYISHKQQRFAILRGRDKDDTHTAAIGFPPPWTVTSSRAAQRGDPADVPGWVKEERKVGGMVVNLAGARPAGSAGG